MEGGTGRAPGGTDNISMPFKVLNCNNLRSTTMALVALIYKVDMSHVAAVSIYPSKMERSNIEITTWRQNNYGASISLNKFFRR